MVWGAILGSTGKKVLVIWERDDWGTISAQTYVDHILTPVLWKFWYWESRYSNGGMPLWLMEDGAPTHQAGFTKSRQEEYGMPKFD